MEEIKLSWRTIWSKQFVTEKIQVWNDMKRKPGETIPELAQD